VTQVLVDYTDHLGWLPYREVARQLVTAEQFYFLSWMWRVHHRLGEEQNEELFMQWLAYTIFHWGRRGVRANMHWLLHMMPSVKREVMDAMATFAMGVNEVIALMTGRAIRAESGLRC